MNLNAGYRAPLNLDRFFGEKRFEQCSVKESIASYAHMLIITCYGEYEFDPEFGCEVWEYEFEHHQTTKIWVERISARMKKMLLRYERRLIDVEVKARLSQEEFDVLTLDHPSKRMKRKLQVLINAKMRATNEPFSMEDNILISPFSID